MSERQNSQLFYVETPPGSINTAHIEQPQIDICNIRKRNEEDVIKNPKPLTFEDVLMKVGLFGPYQIFTCAVIQYVSLEWAGTYSFMLNVGSLEPSWKCNVTGRNITYWTPSNRTEASCHSIKNCSNFSAYQSEFKSVVQEWQLICDNTLFAQWIFAFFLIGQIFGSIVGGIIGDHLGRKTGFFTSQFCVIITSVLATAATDWQGFAVCQFLNGFFLGIIEVTSFTLMMEYTDSHYRLIPNAVFQWTFGYMVAALVAWLTKDWRLYLIFLNLLSAPVLLGFMLFYESPRWLIAKGKLVRAAQVLTETGRRWNRRSVIFSADDLEHLPVDDKWRPYSIYHIFSTKKLAIQSMLQMLSMFTLSIMSDNYNRSIRTMKGTIFLHMFYFGIFRFWVPIFIVYLDFKVPRFGRKTLYLCSLSLSIVCFLINAILVWSGVPEDHSSVVTFDIIATLNNESAFSMAIIQITAVAYPTVIRATAFGSLHITKHIGVMVDFLLLQQLHDLWLPSSYIIPLIIGCITFILAFIYQPETKGKRLPDQLIDVQ